MGTLVRALGAGIVASVFGAALYFAVLAIWGSKSAWWRLPSATRSSSAVHVGARSRGGRRFQVLALVLTYWAIPFADLVAGDQGADRGSSHQRSASALRSKAGEATQPAAPATSETPPTRRAPAMNRSTGGGFVLALLQLLAFTLVLPVLVIADMPGRANRSGGYHRVRHAPGVEDDRHSGRNNLRTVSHRHAGSRLRRAAVRFHHLPR